METKSITRPSLTICPQMNSCRTKGCKLVHWRDFNQQNICYCRNSSCTQLHYDQLNEFHKKQSELACKYADEMLYELHLAAIAEVLQKYKSKLIERKEFDQKFSEAYAKLEEFLKKIPDIEISAADKRTIEALVKNKDSGIRHTKIKLIQLFVRKGKLDMSYLRDLCVKEVERHLKVLSILGD